MQDEAQMHSSFTAGSSHMTTDSKAVCGGGEDLQQALSKLYRHALNCPGAEYDGDAIESANRVLSAALASTAGAGDWQPTETAPKDGTRFWGKVGDDAIAMLWHDGFEAFVSGWRRIEMAPGYTINGKPYEDHSPSEHRPEAWMLMPGQSPAVPASPRSGAGEGEELRQAAQPLADIAAQWDDIRSGNPEAADETLVSVSLGELRALNRSLSQGGGAGRSEKGEGEEETAGADNPWLPIEQAPERTLVETMERTDAVVGTHQRVGKDWWAREMACYVSRRLTHFRYLPAPAQSPSPSDGEG